MGLLNSEPATQTVPGQHGVFIKHAHPDCYMTTSRCEHHPGKADIGCLQKPRKMRRP